MSPEALAAAWLPQLLAAAACGGDAGPFACAPMPRPLLLALAAGLLLAAPGQAQTCSQLRTCAEAMQALQAGNSKLDKDGDGIPCESLCKGYRPPASTGGNRSGMSAPAAVAPSRPALAPRPAAVPLVPAGPVELVSVGDGDTIRVRGRNGQPVTVRLACIDAPETAQGESGTQATLVLKQLLGAGGLEIRPQTVDRYGRTVSEVYAAGRNVNLEMVRMGLAYAYRDYLRGCDANAYLGAEAQAERFRQGVWRWGNEVRPWDFRKQQRAN